MKVLFIDTACTAFAVKNTDWQPHCVRVGAILDDGGENVGSMNHLVELAPGWKLDAAAAPYHLATPQDFAEQGVPLATVAAELAFMLKGVELIVSHNASFHNRLVASIYKDAGIVGSPADGIPTFCTQNASQPICRLNPQRLGRWKAPKLKEAYRFFSGGDMPELYTWEAHSRMQAFAVRDVYNGIKRRQRRQGEPDTKQPEMTPPEDGDGGYIIR